jgi:hypothetical protein
MPRRSAAGRSRIIALRRVCAPTGCAIYCEAGIVKCAPSATSTARPATTPRAARTSAALTPWSTTRATMATSAFDLLAYVLVWQKKGCRGDGYLHADGKQACFRRRGVLLAARATHETNTQAGQGQRTQTPSRRLEVVLWRSQGRSAPGWNHPYRPAAARATDACTRCAGRAATAHADGGMEGLARGCRCTGDCLDLCLQCSKCADCRAECGHCDDCNEYPDSGACAQVGTPYSTCEG